MMKVKSERELNVIRGKLMAGHASTRDIMDFLTYVSALELLVEEASNRDFYGTEGWTRRLGWDE